MKLVDNGDDDLAWDDDEFELPNTDIKAVVASATAPGEEVGDDESTEAPSHEAEYEAANDEWLNSVAAGTKTDFGRVAFSANRRNKQLPQVNLKGKKQVAGSAQGDVDGQIQRLCQAFSKKKRVIDAAFAETLSTREKRNSTPSAFGPGSSNNLD